MLETVTEDEIKAQIPAELESNPWPQPREAKPADGQAARPRLTAPLRLAPPEPTETGQQAAPTRATCRVAGYLIEERGIFAEISGGDPAFVCSPLEVVATYAASDGRGWGRLVRVRSAAGTWVCLRIDNADLQGAASKVLARLADSGLELGSDKKAKEYVIHILKQWKPERHLLSVPQVGWTSSENDTFLVGDVAIGKGDVLPLEFAGAIKPRGDWKEWRDKVGRLCIGNPMMILAVSLAFSGPLMRLCGMHGGGLHFRGASSSGKTTLLALANSVWADRKAVRQWRATSNGIEVLAQRSNDMLLALDELSEIKARDLSESIYMLANGVPKVRMTKDIGLMEGPNWCLALISSGEISVAQKLSEAGSKAMAGHEVRLIDIEADIRSYGVFDELHGCQSGAELADKIRMAVHDTYGAAGRRFVEKVIDHMPVVQKILSMTEQLTAKWKAQLPADPDGQVMRVAQRFAVISIAGRLATAFGLTGWPPAAAEEAAEAVFLDWYDRTQGEKQDAARDALQRLQSYLSTNGSLIQSIGAGENAVAAPEAWKDASRLYLLPEVWSRLMAGLDEKVVGRALVEVGVLLQGDGERLMRKAPRWIPGRPRLYTVSIERLAEDK